MKNSELKKTIESLPDDAEIVITDHENESIRNVEKVEFCKALNEIHLTLAPLE